MKEKKKLRTIQIPEWMDDAVFELAVKNKRSINEEIEFLVEAAVRSYTARKEANGPAAVLPETMLDGSRI
ncbi:hypothetical protein [Leadbettera azotonutricia]|uniref:Arc-like DNA binding domain-containing protein n=1 Tax=Leadbettera azotonutricia (strain ATCC BAA-888 / DSM 13862 / ZAS-9) TaxID=545695 RepID=F5YEG0_LEAAZ|nr:hypothetical protein [Leadbettera azotonutricia]AEF83283.1 hypothetical protein TREAZ_2610 [Leadbettera azotonutricia ZAS-9]